MTFLRSRGLRLGALCILVALTVFQIKRQWTQEGQASIGRSTPIGQAIPQVKRQRTQEGQAQGTQEGQAPIGRFVPLDRDIPPEGKVAGIDTGGQVPGNPDKTIEAMKRIHAFVGIYRAKHGSNPEGCSALIFDIMERRREYGLENIKNWRDVEALFTNPDTRYQDFSFLSKSTTIFAYAIGHNRLDGTPYGGPKAPGTRDISVMTDLYVHANVRHFRGGPSTTNPVGFYIVVWDDGQVEKIPYDKQLYVPLPSRGDGATRYVSALPGQAGVPAGALTYDEVYKKGGWKKAPRGEAGGKGSAYNTP